MKKMAIKGLVALAAVVALCMFFSGTIKTISTAKVKLVTARQGKLEEQIKLQGQLSFPETAEVKLSLPDDQTVTVTRVAVARGRKVSKGDVLFTAEVGGYAKTIESLRKEYETAQTELLELERKNGDLRLKRTEENWVDAYDALLQSKEDVLTASTSLQVAAQMQGITLENGRLPDGVKDETLLALQDQLVQAEKAQAAAQKRFDSANRLGISEEVLTYVTKTRELKQTMAEKQDAIVSLEVLAKQVGAVTAPHDGYIVEINIKAGEGYDGKTAAIVMSAADSDPVLRADVSQIERSIDKGTEVTIRRSNEKTTTKKVTGSGVNSDGKRYVDVKLTDKDVTNLGGGAALLSGTTVEMVASYRAKSSTTLLPTSAVRGSGDSRYVYIVNEEDNALGQRVLKIRKQDVTVLAEVGNTASLETDLSRQRVAYMEDRSISDGSEVMVYGE